MEWGISWELIESREYWVYKWLIDKLVVDKFDGMMFAGYEQVIFRNIFDIVENLKIDIENEWNMTYSHIRNFYFYWCKRKFCVDDLLIMNW